MVKIIFAFTMSLFLFSVFPLPSLASGNTWCVVEYVDTAKNTMNSSAISLGQVTFSDSLCKSASVSMDTFADSSKVVVDTWGQSLPSGTDPVSFYSQNTWSRPITEEEKNSYWCLLGGSGTDFESMPGAADWLIDFLPESPDALKIPKLIAKLSGEGTLYANLLIEIWNGSWQAFLIFALIRLYKLIPFKAT